MPASKQKKLQPEIVALHSPFSEHSCTEYAVWISSGTHRIARTGLKDDFAPSLVHIGVVCPTMPVLPDRGAQRKMKK
jgi:hypothetical protein